MGVQARAELVLAAGETHAEWHRRQLLVEKDLFHDVRRRLNQQFQEAQHAARLRENAPPYKPARFDLCYVFDPTATNDVWSSYAANQTQPFKSRKLATNWHGPYVVDGMDNESTVRVIVPYKRRQMHEIDWIERFPLRHVRHVDNEGFVMRERDTVWIPEEVTSHLRHKDGSDTYKVVFVNGCNMARRTERKAAHEVPAEMVQRWLDSQWFESLREQQQEDAPVPARASGAMKRSEGQRRGRPRLDREPVAPSNQPTAAAIRREARANAAKLREAKLASKLAAAIRAARESQTDQAEPATADDKRTKKRTADETRAARISKRTEAATAKRDSTAFPAGDAGKMVTTRSAAVHTARTAAPHSDHNTTPSARVPRTDRRHSRRNRVGDS